jgi:hypothetical protein
MDQELENALKLYLIGKKNINNNPKSLSYLKKSIENINLIKNKFKNISDEKLNIINITEADCKKILKNYDNVFNLITKNDLQSIKKITSFNFREINQNGDTILHHCINIGDTTILKELLKKGGCIDQVNGNGNTLLEYACLKKDPNIIEFLINHGANLKKHLFFRKKDMQLYLNKSDIDCAILLRVIINNSKNNNDYSLFDFFKNYFSWNELIGLEKYTIKDLCIGLTNMFKNKQSYNTFKNIIIDDLNNFKNNNIKKNINKLDIVLFNLIPFISYPFLNIGNSYIIKNELKYLVKKVLKDSQTSDDLKQLLLNKLFDTYIKTELYPKDYIGILIYQILNKFNKIKI